MKFVKIMLVAMVALIVSSCSMKDAEVEEYNKTADYWYNELAQSIADSNMDRADSLYISLKTEHINSPLMKSAVMMLAHSHMEEENYLLANYYLDEFNKRYSHTSSREYTDFMKLKASFMGIQDVYKDQKLIMDTTLDAKRFKYRYPSSMYNPLVDTIFVKLEMAQYLLNENIASLYDRRNKPAAAQLYRDKNKNSIVTMTDITPPTKSLMGQLFD